MCLRLGVVRERGLRLLRASDDTDAVTCGNGTGGLGGDDLVVYEEEVDMSHCRACVSIGLYLYGKAVKLTGDCISLLIARAL